MVAGPAFAGHRQASDLVEQRGPAGVGAGDTLEECIAEMREAIAFHLDGMTEDGEAIPDPTGPGVYVEHATAAA